MPDLFDGPMTFEEVNFPEDYNITFSYYAVTLSDDLVCSPDKSLAFEAVFVPVMYTTALLLGLMGNGLVLAVLWQKRRTWSVTDTFILHLAVADLLLLLTLPFWAVNASQGWIFGTFLCKITGALFKINFYCGIFLLACISVDRYLSIVHAVQMYTRKKPWVVQASCLSVWFICFLLAIPDWLYLKDIHDYRRDKTECTYDYPHPKQSWGLGFCLLYHILGFLVPAAIMVFCYTCILRRLFRSSQSLQRQRAMQVIWALVAAFFVCWTPYNIALMADTFNTINDNVSSGFNDTSCDTYTVLDISLRVTSTLGYMHCCINPLLYAFVGVKFRRHLVEMLKVLHCPGNHRTSHRSSIWSETGNTNNTTAF